MAAEYNFPSIVKGDTFRERTITIVVDGVPLDLTGATVCMQLKLDPLRSAVKTFTTTITDALNGVITLAAFTVDFAANIYQYDLKITLADGSILTYIEGTFQVVQNISQCP